MQIKDVAYEALPGNADAVTNLGAFRERNAFVRVTLAGSDAADAVGKLVQSEDKVNWSDCQGANASIVLAGDGSYNIETDQFNGKFIGVDYAKNTNNAGTQEAIGILKG